MFVYNYGTGILDFVINSIIILIYKQRESQFKYL